jgi:hypothetical protein
VQTNDDGICSCAHTVRGIVAAPECRDELAPSQFTLNPQRLHFNGLGDKAGSVGGLAEPSAGDDVGLSARCTDGLRIRRLIEANTTTRSGSSRKAGRVTYRKTSHAR